MFFYIDIFFLFLHIFFLFWFVYGDLLEVLYATYSYRGLFLGP